MAPYQQGSSCSTRSGNNADSKNKPLLISRLQGSPRGRLPGGAPMRGQHRRVRRGPTDP